MAARGSSPLQYVVIGALGLFAFNWAESQPATSGARKTAEQLRAAINKAAGRSTVVSPANQPGFTPQRVGEQTASGSQGGAVALPGGGVLIPTFFLDQGQQPIVFDPGVNAIRQDPRVGGTNVYGAGAGVIDTRDGQAWVYLGGTSFQRQDNGATQGLSYFEAPA